MSVDYRLLAGFQASQKRQEAARRILPERWREDPRAVAQIINDHWAGVILAAAKRRAGAGRPALLPVLSVDGR